LHHRKGDFRLNADDYGSGASQPNRLRQLAKGTGGKGVHYLQSGDIDDHAPGPTFSNLGGQIIAKLQEVLIGKN
jgi:hypothetical protein